MMDERTLAVIAAAIEAYLRSEDSEIKRFGQRISPWKMAGRRETMSRRALIVRANPARTSLRRFSLI